MSSSNSIALKRLNNEFSTIQKALIGDSSTVAPAAKANSPASDVPIAQIVHAIELVNQNIMEWIVTLNGPPGSAYESYLYKIKLTFSSSYPSASPSIVFISPIIHINIDSNDNKLCNEIVTNQWKPTLRIVNILAILYNVMENPITASPINSELANLYDNTAKYTEFIQNFNKKNNAIKKQ